MVQSCLVCQQAKPELVNYHVLLSPLPVPSKTWETVTMDFIFGLPSSCGYECLLVVKIQTFLSIETSFQFSESGRDIFG